MKTITLRAQRGVTMLMVLIMMAVMLLGGLALARMTETSLLSAGNVANEEAAVHASEVGWNTAFASVKALANEDNAVPSWYWATMQATDPNGIPIVAWDAAEEVVVGRFSVRYVVERMCNVTPVTTATRQCLVKQTDVLEDRRSDALDYTPKSSRQFRITVRVTDARGTQTWAQSLVTRGG
jgi:Tfp pilus assembly protein PilV